MAGLETIVIALALRSSSTSVSFASILNAGKLSSNKVIKSLFVTGASLTGVTYHPAVKN